MDLKSLIRDVPNFPQPGIVFRDITPVLANAQGLGAVIQGLAAPFRDRAIDYVLGMESRGFILAAPVAQVLGCGFVPVRKPKKLPAPVYTIEYALEYGTDRLEIHQDAIAPGSKVLIIDDVIATGGTAAATAKLVELAQGDLVGFGFMIELDFLQGRRSLPAVEIVSLVHY
ncbi:MAG: adenine phosphoribosyltransferase [Pseudanabaenaceae cyanobacterium bins.68]|nr:adenine phosphoribosyltransferase [Pseudanabaenaceae cyanobacterium bins.68]